MTVESGNLPLSFRAGQIAASTPHVRSTAGGAEFDLHHWLPALLEHDSVADAVLGDVDRDALAQALDRRLEEGHLDFPFPRSEALARASQDHRGPGWRHRGRGTTAAAGAESRDPFPPSEPDVRLSPALLR